MEKRLYIFADNEIFEVLAFDGLNIYVCDKNNWTDSIPLTRVERFCDKDGKHIKYYL